VTNDNIPTEDKEQDHNFEVPIEKSSEVALRHYPQMTTKAVPVLVGGKPIRARRASAKWCVGVIEKLWDVRQPAIRAEERPEAE